MAGFVAKAPADVIAGEKEKLAKYQDSKAALVARLESSQRLMKIIARIQTDFPDKFGIPRQSGLVQELQGKIVFEPEFRSPEAVRGLWPSLISGLLWQFSKAHKARWSPTVPPPRLGRRQTGGGVCHPLALPPQ